MSLKARCPNSQVRASQNFGTSGPGPRWVMAHARSGECVLTAAEYLKLAEQCFALARATLNQDTRKVFLEAGRDYLAKAKALDPTIPDPKTVES